MLTVKPEYKSVPSPTRWTLNSRRLRRARVFDALSLRAGKIQHHFTGVLGRLEPAGETTS
jgi:hypothetical protein